MKQAIGEAVTLLSGNALRTTRVDAIEQGKNYTIDTLTTVLEALELKLIIK